MINFQSSTETSAILPIDRTTSFDPEKFIDPGWKVKCHDSQSIAISELNLLSLRLEEGVTRPDERRLHIAQIDYLRACGRIHLDAQVLETLWRHQDRIPAHLKSLRGGLVTCICFDGTTLESPHLGWGFCSLCLWWASFIGKKGGLWQKGIVRLNDERGLECVSAVIER